MTQRRKNFCDNRPPDIVSFFSDFMSVTLRRLTLGRFEKITLCRPDVISFWFWLHVSIKNDFKNVIFQYRHKVSKKLHNFGPLCHFFCSKFDRCHIIFSDFMSVIEKRLYEDPTCVIFVLTLCRKKMTPPRPM
jgi:hypothetical protein